MEIAKLFADLTIFTKRIDVIRTVSFYHAPFPLLRMKTEKKEYSEKGSEAEMYRCMMQRDWLTTGAVFVCVALTTATDNNTLSTTS